MKTTRIIVVSMLATLAAACGSIDPKLTVLEDPNLPGVKVAITDSGKDNHGGPRVRGETHYFYDEGAQVPREAIMKTHGGYTTAQTVAPSIAAGALGAVSAVGAAALIADGIRDQKPDQTYIEGSNAEVSGIDVSSDATAAAGVPVNGASGGGKSGSAGLRGSAIRSGGSQSRGLGIGMSGGSVRSMGGSGGSYRGGMRCSGGLCR